MPRLREVPRDEVHDFGKVIYQMLFGDRDPVAEPGTATGSPGNWWTVFAQSPDAFDHACGSFAFYRNPDRELDPKLRELGQIRAGYARGSRFVPPAPGKSPILTSGRPSAASGVATR